VQEQDIDIVQPQILKAFLNGGQETIFPEIFGMNFRCDAELIPGDASLGKPFADIRLVAIHLGGIEGAIANIDRSLYGVGELGALEREGAE
jgi:hypothetical protein